MFKTTCFILVQNSRMVIEKKESERNYPIFFFFFYQDMFPVCLPIHIPLVNFVSLEIPQGENKDKEFFNHQAKTILSV